MDPGCSRTTEPGTARPWVAAWDMDIIMTSGGFMDHWYQHGPWKTMSTDIRLASGGSQTKDTVWPWVVPQAKDIHMAPGCCMTMDNHINVWLWNSLEQWLAATKVVSRLSIAHRSLLRKFNPDINYSSFWASFYFLEPGWSRSSTVCWGMSQNAGSIGCTHPC